MRELQWRQESPCDAQGRARRFRDGGGTGRAPDKRQGSSAMSGIWLAISPPTIAISSGRRSSAPSPKPIASGNAPKAAASVVMRIGRKRRSEASRTAARGVSPRDRSASSAKSMMRMAFFLTIPIRKNDSNKSNDVEFAAGRNERDHRSNPGRGEGGKRGQRMNCAFIENAKNYVDREQGRHDQNRHARGRLGKGFGSSAERAVNGRRKLEAGLNLLDRLGRGSKSYARRQIERDGR